MGSLAFLQAQLQEKHKKPFPLLSFPSVSLLKVSVAEITNSAELQALGMKAVADKTNALAAVGMMDLSVEAEAFGSQIKVSENEVPTVIGALISDEEEAKALRVPAVGEGRTGVYIGAVEKALTLITDRPVFAGVIGPFSLAGRLMDVSEALVNCLAEPDFVHETLRKVTAFLIAYAKAYKQVGAAGIVMAEPLAGLLSPALETEFSAPYVKEMIAAVQDEDFAVIYHNCGPNTPLMTASLAQNGASGYHFGDAVDLKDLLEKMPADKPVFGNISPAGQFLGGTPETMATAVAHLRERCSSHPNFILSSGCDIPPASPWVNIEAFFQAASPQE